MRRKPIPQSLFNWIALISANWFVVIEWVFKPMYPNDAHAFSYLILELLSKATLAMFTGSIFFRITESFRSKKKKEEAADVQYDFLAECAYHFNRWHQLNVKMTDDQLEREAYGWLQVGFVGFEVAMEERKKAGASRSQLLFDAVGKSYNYSVPYQGLFSRAFTKAQKDMVNEFQQVKEDWMPFEVHIEMILAFRRRLVMLMNQYATEHGTGVLVSIAA
jgi:hypothetical protein